MNTVVIVGRLTRDPELRTVNTNNGMNSTCSFSIAVDKPFTNQSGTRDADFINCVIWGKQAENLAKYCTKGSLIGIEGRINTRNYDGADGKKVYVTEVYANTLKFLGGRNNGVNAAPQNTFENNGGYMPQNNGNNDSNIQNDLQEDPFKEFRNENFDAEDNVILNDDQLPF